MARLKVPSLQHLARCCRETPEETSKVLVKLALNPPSFSYAPLYGLITDLLVLKQPLDDILHAIRTRIKREFVRDNFLELLPLIDQYFKQVSPTFVQSVSGRMYPIGRELIVPFNPPLLYGSGGTLHFPWFSTWRTNPLSGRNLSLFVTAVDDILGQDPQFEDAIFHILDFSAPGYKKPRQLRIIDSREVPRLTPSELEAMLIVFANGFELAAQELSYLNAKASRNANEPRRSTDLNQDDLFPDDPVPPAP